MTGMLRLHLRIGSEGEQEHLMGSITLLFLRQIRRASELMRVWPF
jgi:hypothetical protein